MKYVSQAKEPEATGTGLRCGSGSLGSSRPVDGRSSTTTSEKLDVTAGETAPHFQLSADSEPVAFINNRLADLAEANALYGKDQRLSAPDKIARNEREISWLKELRSIIKTEPQSALKPFDVGYIDGIILAGLLDEWENGAYDRDTKDSAERLSRRLAERIAYSITRPLSARGE